MILNKTTVFINRPDGVVGYHVSLTPIRSWDRAPVWSLLFVPSLFATLLLFCIFVFSFVPFLFPLALL
ncbi:hypothetical protein BDV24DRAFT_129217, partial [Aspergillus arachidicola]